MTSEFTLGPTIKFFKEHDFFHLDPTNVVLFEQRMLPAVTFEGKAILERKDKVAMAPGMAHTLDRNRLPHLGHRVQLWIRRPDSQVRCTQASYVALDMWLWPVWSHRLLVCAPAALTKLCRRSGQSPWVTHSFLLYRWQRGFVLCTG